MLQEEVDLTDLFDPKEFPVEQVIVSPPEQLDTPRERGGFRPGSLTPRGRGPSFWPRSFPPVLDYPVQFPPWPADLRQSPSHLSPWRPSSSLPRHLLSSLRFWP